MAKKKKRKPGNIIAMVIMIAISIVCIYYTAKEFGVKNQLKAEINENETILKELNSQKKKLSKEKKNLENPDYLVRYARGRYMVTNKDGEQVFKLPDEE